MEESDAKPVPNYLGDNMEIVRKIVTVYKKNTVFWDPKNSGYYSKAKREEAWESMANEVNIPLPILKKKMNSLLGSYRRERSRERRSGVKPSGNTFYKSKWFAYEWFRFLDNKNVFIIADDSYDHDSNNGGSDENEDCNDDITTPSQNQSTSTAPPSTSRVRKRRIGELKPELHALRQNHLRADLLRQACTIIKKSSEDCYQSFGNLVACELRKYSAAQLPHVKKAILDILYKADIGEFPYMKDPLNEFVSREGSQTPNLLTEEFSVKIEPQ